MRNATEAINLVRYTWARAHVGQGDVVLITRDGAPLERRPVAAAVPGAGRAARSTCESTTRAASTSTDARRAPRGRAACGWSRSPTSRTCSGTINPVAEISERAHDAGALVLVDGAQAVPQLPVDVRRLGADFYAFTGHKMLGPTGIGVLWARRELLEEMPPFMGGGSMINAVEDEHSTWAAPPAKFEAGTPAIAEAVGPGRSRRLPGRAGHGRGARARDGDHRVRAGAAGGLDGLRIFGPPDAAERGGLVSFALEGVHPHDIAEICNREAVAIRAGHHCAQPLMRAWRAGHRARLLLGL